MALLVAKHFLWTLYLEHLLGIYLKSQQLFVSCFS